MMKMARFLVAGSLVLSIGVLFMDSAYAKHSEENCSAVEIVLARGSGQDINKGEMYYFRTALKNILDKSKITSHYYELGVEHYGGSSYPAISMDVFKYKDRVTKAKQSKGMAYEYGDSVSKGVNEFKYYIKERSNKCKKSRFVFAGYSQGAQVVGQAMFDFSKEVLDRVDFVALFGDPKLNLPEGRSRSMFSLPESCTSGTRSLWRRGSASCVTHSGALDFRDPYLTKLSDIRKKTGSWCNKNDGVCGDGAPFMIDGHLNYIDSGSISLATLEAYSKLKLQKDNSVILKSEIMHDNLVVIDASRLKESPEDDSHLEYVKSVIKNKGLFSKNNKVAVIAFAEGHTHSMRVVTDFTNDEKELSRAIDTIRAEYSYRGAIWGNDFFSRVDNLGSGLKWRFASKRSVVTMDRRGYQSRCETKFVTCFSSDMYERCNGTLNNSPQITFSHSKNVGKTDYQVQLTDDHNGHLDDIDNINNTDDDRTPIVIPSIGGYRIKVGDTVRFNVDQTYAYPGDTIVEYRWDFNSDGAVDAMTTEPYATHTFNEPFDGLVYVYACSNGSTVCGTGTIDVKVTDKDSIPPAMSGTLRYKWISSSEIELSWGLDFKNADGIILYLDDVPLGVLDLDRESIIITDLDETRSHRFMLQVINEQDELTGNKLYLEAPPRSEKSSGSAKAGSSDKLSPSAITKGIASIFGVSTSDDKERSDEVKDDDKNSSVQNTPEKSTSLSENIKKLTPQDRSILLIIIAVFAVLMVFSVGLFIWRYKRAKSSV